MAETTQIWRNLIIHHEWRHKIYYAYGDVSIAPSDVEIIFEPSEIWNGSPAAVKKHFRKKLKGKIDDKVSFSTTTWAPYEETLPDANGVHGTGYMETLFNDTKNTYHTDSYPDRSKRWTAQPYFDYRILDIPTPYVPFPPITSAEMRREDLLEAIDRVARRAGVTVLRMITYRRDPSSTDLEHRIHRQTIFADGHVEEFTYIISHTAATQLKHNNALETQQETSDEEMASTPSKPVKHATTPAKSTATKVPRASAAKKNRVNIKFPDTISTEMAEVTPTSKKRAVSSSTTTRKVAPRKFGQDSSDEELPDTPSSRPAKKAKLAKLSDSDEEEIAEDEPPEEPSQPKDASATTEEHKNKSKAELEKLVKKDLIKIIFEIRKTHISNVCETLFEMADIYENLITPRLNPNNYSSSRPGFVKGATKAIESLGGAIEELPDRNLTLLKSTEALGKKVARGNMVRNVHKKIELNRWSGKWKDGETMDE
ncbi:hypothetical protein BLS_005752 [Venturia inaequalis]|uniref:Uncharacterized protein n=1 Tax=Venturia inaequalis TaxID=5025 RepID=A0A8H3YQW8_VENIN|nr:hypothetical protein BLS_005752 [Venturia inaequalis]